MIETLNMWAAMWSDWALASLVEGAVLLAVVGAVWRIAARRASAQFGYLLFLLVLVRLAAPAAIAVPAEWGWLSPRDAIGRAVGWWNEDRRAQNSPRIAAPAATDTAAPPPSAEWLAANADLLPRPAESHAAIAPAPAATPAPTLSLSAWLMLLWSAVAAALLARFAWEQWKWRRRFASAAVLDASVLPLDFAALSRRLGVRRRLLILESSAVESPAVWGLIRPRLIVPPGFVARLPRDQLAWVLAHELAHVRRGDLWVALVQRILQIVYFFHPAVWLANRAIDRQREYACDDAAFAAADCAGRECGSALVAVAALALGQSPQPALSLFSSPSLLKRRVVRLLAAQPGAPLRLSPAAFCALVLAFVLLLPHLRAAEPKPTAEPDVQADAERQTTAPEEKSRERDSRNSAAQAPDKAQAVDAKPTLEARAAAIAAIRKTGGNLNPDFEKLRAADDWDFNNPAHEFIDAFLFLTRIEKADEVLANLAQFPELQRVWLSGANVTDDGLGHLEGFRNLRALHLDSTAVTDKGLSHLAALENLQELDLSKTNVTSRGMQWLTLIKNLRRIDLGHTLVDDDGLKRLAALEKLESLNLNYTKVTDAGLRHLAGGLENLKQLSLEGVAITDAGLGGFKSFSGLGSLDLTGTAITDAGLQELDPQRTLTSLSLSNTKVGDASAAWIAGRMRLMHLDLGGTGLTDAGLAKLAGLNKLEYLTLSGTQITDEGLKSLTGLKNLKSLQLADTHITDAGLAHLKPLVQLQDLDLTGTKIEDPRLEPLTFLPALTTVEVRNTAVTASDVYRALPQTNRNVQKILAALNENTELEFVDQPLSDVVDYLKERHDIQIVLDTRSLVEAKKDSATPITINLRGETLKDALKMLFAKYDLAMAVRHEVLMIGAKPLTPEPPSLPILPEGTRISPKLGTALGELTELEFVGQPYIDVVKYLKERHNVEIVLDVAAVTKAPVDTPITYNVRGISLKSALELMLGELDLTCYAEGDRLIVRPIR